MINERLEYMRDNYEILGGVKIMAPAPNIGHNVTLVSLASIIEYHMLKNDITGYVCTDNIDVHLPDGTLFKPDLTVILPKNKDIINWGGAIHGVPDMVVEVLSKSTKHRDRTLKKDIYEANGVKEYWITDPFMKCVEVYILTDGKFELTGEYQHYTPYEIERLTDEEKKDVKYEVPVSILPGLSVDLNYIFRWGS